MYIVVDDDQRMRCIAIAFICQFKDIPRALCVNINFRVFYYSQD